MKKNIHPGYHDDAKIICSCGNVIETGSVVKEMKVEICSACHPFYTGKKKSIDIAGRVDRFKRIAEKKALIKPRKERIRKPKAETKKVISKKKLKK